MNWIIRNSKKLRWQTDLTELFKPIYKEIENYNWILSDIEYNGTSTYNDLPINYDHDYFILSPKQFRKLVDIDIQIYWAIILGVPIDIEIKIDENELPYADGNGLVWKNGNIQYPDASIEIICFDSGYTIVKFKDETLSDTFKEYFDEAIELEKFHNKSAPYY
jgi:hypothetical protein